MHNSLESDPFTAPEGDQCNSNSATQTEPLIRYHQQLRSMAIDSAFVETSLSETRQQACNP
jgi:hypothetical protein